MAAVSRTSTRVEVVPLQEQIAPPSLDALFVMNSLAVGGSETKVVRLTNALHARAAEVGIVYLNAPHSLLKQIHPEVPVWHMDRQGKYSFATMAALRHLIREQRPRALVAVSLYPALYVVTAACTVPRRPRTIGLVNTTDFNPGEEWRRKFYLPVLRRLDWTVYGCELQRRAWVGDGPDGRSSVIYNGVDTAHFRPTGTLGRRARQDLGIPPSAFVVGTVGRLAPEKGQAALIDAVVRMRAAGVDAHLLLVGDGPLRAELQAHCARQGLQAVTFAGTQSDVRPMLAAMDVFALPSLYVETFSNAALEAMAMGRPVVLSAIGGAAEMVRDGVDGYLIPPERIPELLPQVLMKLEAEPELREQIGAAATQRVESSFSFDNMVDGYGDLLECAHDGCRSA